AAPTTAPSDAPRVPRATLAQAANAEELLVTLMLHDPAVVTRVDEENAVEFFEEGAWRTFAIELVEAARRGTPLDPATMLARFDEAIAARITGRLLASGDEDETRRQIVVDCFAKLRHRARERERLRVLRQIRDAEARGDVEEVAEGQRQLQELRQV